MAEQFEETKEKAAQEQTDTDPADTAPEEVTDEAPAEAEAKAAEEASDTEKTDTSEKETEEEKPDPQKEIDDLKKQLANEKERYLRLDAEYYNFRQRSVKEKSEAYENASIDAAKELISVIDNFERAAKAECTDENFKKGIDMIFKQYLGILDKLGIKEIEAEGAAFDPNFHNAVSSVENEELGENVVAAVFQKGYITASGKVVRPAMVTVANP